MPSALETLVKILKLEREKGFQNTAVDGGLSAFSVRWAEQAHTQARKPEHHALVDELTALLQRYEADQLRDNRSSSIEYMMGRITGRVPAPPEAIEAAAAWAQRVQSAPPPNPTPNQPSQQNDAPAPQREHPEQKRHEGKKHDSNQPRDEQRQQRPQNNQKRDQGQSRQNQKGSPQRQGSEGEGGGDTRGDFSNLDAMEFRSGASHPDLPEMPRLARPPRAPRREMSAEEASDLLRGLNSSVDVVRGVGPSKEEMLQRLGIHTINDLLTFLPRRYDDYTQISLISRLEANKTVTVIGTVKHTEVRIGQRGRKDFFMVVDDGSATIGVTFFSQHYLMQAIRPGAQLVLHGDTTEFRGRIQLTNPDWDLLDVDDLKTIGIVPVYPLTEGLNGKSLRKLMKRTIEYWSEQVPDYVPETTLDRTELGDLGWSYRNLHFPESWDHLHHARRRFVFDELLLMQLAILDNRRIWQSEPAQPLHISDEDLQAITAAMFPYALTGAQQKSIADIRADIARDVPMNRLLQGDVGSGKTAVAITAAAIAFLNGKQSAIMVPTSILAEQHFHSIGRALAAIPTEQKPNVALLTGSTPPAQRDAIYEGLANGSIHIIIGTHALIQQGINFANLGFAVIDEQHRFGVEQRGLLRGKGSNPHLLVMTATPIPRTLALTLYADLDLSVISEMPPGRVPVKTRMVDQTALERVHDFVKARLNEGQQAFIVYPLVEASESIEAESAVEAFEQLKQVYFRYRVGLLHGRMKPAEKDTIMTAFREHEYDLLVTTSVAEVGVDIPNASVIVINGANRFGLASLHQFRGRVGRGGLESFCFLVSDSDQALAQNRLRALEQTNDGFKLAEIDWKLRGPGDLVGTRQSGQPVFQMMEAMTPELVELAQREARTIYEEDITLSQPQHRLLAQRVKMLRDERSDLS